MMGACQKDTETNLKELPMAIWDNLSKKINNDRNEF